MRMTPFLLCFLFSLSIYAQNFKYQLDPWGNDSIRVRICPTTNTIVEPPLSALLPKTESTTLVIRNSQSDLVNGNLNVVVDGNTGLVTATRVSDNKVLLQAQKLTFGAPFSNGTRTGSVSTLLTFNGHGSSSKVYGLGEHRTGKVNQMPYFKNFSSSQDYGQSSGSDVSIPWYSSSEGYGFVWNLPSYGYVNITADTITWYSWASLNADFWITTTPASFDPKTTSPYAPLLHNYADAVGHAPPMPFYSTGFIQCKDRYRNQSQILDVARGYVSRGLPISVIVIDWQHWVNEGDWSFNPVCWPDPQGMFDELKTLGIELMVTFWPFQTPPSQHWNEFTTNGYLVPRLNGTLQPYDGSQYLYDSTNPKARQAVFNAFVSGYGKYGIKTVWIDAAEPEHFGNTLDGSWKLSLGTDAEVMEAWVQQHARMMADGMASIGVGPSDYFILPRSTWAGAWRYSAALWSGDISSTFSELALQVKVAQGVAMSGPILWTTDIGGYNGGNPDDATFQDLIVRWFQFGAFCPLFRLHGHRAGGPPSNECGPTNGDNEVWNLAKDTTHYNAIARVMEVRENLRSYVTQINQEAASTGMPMLRPMFLQWPNDAGAQTATVEDQFMFGPDWLVAPVTTYQATSRNVYLPLLPDYNTWVYFYNETDVGQGGKTISVNTPISEFPLFYRRSSNTKPVYGNATVLLSTERNDTVLCLSSQCYSANIPTDEGHYSTLFADDVAVLSSTTNSVVINGTTYQLIALGLFYSFTHNDNFIATNTTAPDNTYNITFNDGYVLTTQAPGTIPLQVYFKNYDGANNWDYLTCASDSAINWAKTNGYAFKWTTGYVFPAGTVPPMEASNPSFPPSKFKE